MSIGSIQHRSRNFLLFVYYLEKMSPFLNGSLPNLGNYIQMRIKLMNE